MSSFSFSSSLNNTSTYQTNSSFVVPLYAFQSTRNLLRDSKNISEIIRKKRKKGQRSFDNFHSSILKEKFQISMKKINNLPELYLSQNINEKNLKKIELHLPNKADIKIGGLYVKNNNNLFALTESSKNTLRMKCVVEDKKKNLSVFSNEIEDKKKKIKKDITDAEKRFDDVALRVIPKLENYLIFLRRQVVIEKEKSFDLEKQIFDLRAEIMSIKKKITETREEVKLILNFRNLFVMVKKSTLILPFNFYEFDDKVPQILPLRAESPRKSVSYFYHSPGFSSPRKNTRSRGKNKRKKDTIKIGRTKKSTLNLSMVQSYNNKLQSEPIYRYLDPRIPIFETTDEFLSSLRFKEYSSIKLNEQFNQNYETISKLKKVLGKLTSAYNSYSNEHKEELEKNEQTLKHEKKKYNMLKETIKKLHEDNGSRRDTKIKIIELLSSVSVNLSLLKYQRNIERYNFKRNNAYIYLYISNILKDCLENWNFLFKKITNDSIMKIKSSLTILSNPDKNEEILLTEKGKEMLGFVEKILDNLFIYNVQILSSSKRQKAIEIINNIEKMKRVTNARNQRKFLEERKVKIASIMVAKKDRLVIKNRCSMIAYLEKKEKHDKRRVNSVNELNYNDILFFSE